MITIITHHLGMNNNILLKLYLTKESH